VLKYFPTHLKAIRDLLLHCTSALQLTSNGFLKIDVLQDVGYLLRFTSKSFLLFLNDRGPCRNPFEEKRLTRNERIKFAALEQQLQR